ncbi:MAG: zinc-ribbon domain-containing protein [Promethearchaeota archaeon]
MYCTNCGAKINENQKYCELCGNELIAIHDIKKEDEIPKANPTRSRRRCC